MHRRPCQQSLCSCQHSRSPHYTTWHLSPSKDYTYMIEDLEVQSPSSHNSHSFRRHFVLTCLQGKRQTSGWVNLWITASVPTALQKQRNPAQTGSLPNTACTVSITESHLARGKCRRISKPAFTRPKKTLTTGCGIKNRLSILTNANDFESYKPYLISH